MPMPMFDIAVVPLPQPLPHPSWQAHAVGPFRNYYLRVRCMKCGMGVHFQHIEAHIFLNHAPTDDDAAEMDNRPRTGTI